MLKAKVNTKGALHFAEIECQAGKIIVYDNGIGSVRISSTIGIIQGKENKEFRQMVIIARNGITGRNLKTKIVRVVGKNRFIK